MDEIEYRKLSRIEELSEDDFHWRKQLTEEIRDIKKTLRLLSFLVSAIFAIVCIKFLF